MSSAKSSPWSLSLLNSRFPALHGLRVLAVLLVVQLHASDAITHESMGVHIGAVPSNWAALLSFNAWFAMDLFFIMSGFLIGHILLYSFSDNGTAPSKTPSGNVFKRFYLRRSFRTFPLYYFFYFAFYFLNKVWTCATPVSQIGFAEIRYQEMLYLTNYPFEAWRYLAYWSWSLSLEEHFYLLAPFFIFLLMKLSSHRARLIALATTWASGFFVRLGIYLWYVQYAPMEFSAMRQLYTPTHARYDILVAGIFIAYLDFFFSDKVKAFLNRRWTKVLMTSAACAGLAIILSPEINPTPLGLLDTKNLALMQYTAMTGVLYFGTLTGFIYTLIIIQCLYVDNRVTRWLGQHSFLQLATLGYGIYLVHMPVVYKVAELMTRYLPRPQDAFGLHWFCVTSVTMVISTALAYVMHIGIEKPCLFIRDKFVP
jgi:peptidoglycan/LPS O-acetylase OafA/YrhL